VKKLKKEKEFKIKKIKQTLFERKTTLKNFKKWFKKAENTI